MTYAKTNIFEARHQQVAEWAKALAHPARLAILEYLAGAGTCVSGDITRTLPLSRTTASQHLQALKKAGLIKGEISGANVCYCIDTENFAAARAALAAFLTGVAEQPPAPNCDAC